MKLHGKRILVNKPEVKESAFQVGDMVYLQMTALNTSEVVDIDGALKLMVREHDIAITW